MAGQRGAKAPIRVVIRPLSLSMHEVQVEMALPEDLSARGPILAMAAWTPGSYLIRDYARFLDRVALRDAHGAVRDVRKLDKQRWQLPPMEGGAHLSYRLFCNELTVRTNHVDARHAFLTGAATFLFPEGESHRPFTIRFEDFPADWKIASSLPRRGEAYFAEGLDTLLDSPFEAGTFKLHRFAVEGVRFELAITGQHGADVPRILDGCRRIAETCGRMFGGFPFRRYLFLLGFSPQARGGLEHRDGCALLADPHRMDGPDGYCELFSLMAHEFFHAWNVKRLRDAALGPFDYGRENYTRLLWFHEGVTSYMQYAIAVKAGVIPWAWSAGQLARLWTEHHARYGRHVQSLEEASFDAWVRLYKPTEFSANSTVSYYDKGCLVAWMMDGTLRLATKGRKGLEDLLALLWEQVGDGHLEDEDLRAAFERLGKLDPEPFWRDYIRGTAELDATVLERAFGLQLEMRPPWERLPATDRDDPAQIRRAKVYTGLSFNGEGVIQNVVPGSPAAEAGLGYGQEILAVDGWRTSSLLEIQKRMSDGEPGKPMVVLAVDRGRVSECTMKPVENPDLIARVVAEPKPSGAQRAAFRASYGAAHPALGRKGTA